ncbi:hypothetical protein OAI55_01710 [Nitrosopumilus sp.]|nr:hypothetical protein [Nitrosopumilus sp.]
MTANRRRRGQSTSNEHKMIDIQHEIQKLEADLEFHRQKIRLISHELEIRNQKLAGLMDTDALLRKMRDQFRKGLEGERNEN